MGKKKKKSGTTRGPAGQIPGKDNFQRMNFLYQAAHTVMSSNPQNVQLARYYTSTLKRMAKNCVLRLDPNVKRSMCKRCHSLLIPGVTATVRIRTKREKHVVVTCLECRMVSRYLARKDYQLWTELPTSLLSYRQPGTDTGNNSGPVTAAGTNDSASASSTVGGNADQQKQSCKYERLVLHP